MREGADELLLGAAEAGSTVEARVYSSMVEFWSEGVWVAGHERSFTTVRSRSSNWNTIWKFWNGSLERCADPSLWRSGGAGAMAREL